MPGVISKSRISHPQKGPPAIAYLTLSDHMRFQAEAYPDSAPDEHAALGPRVSFECHACCLGQDRQFGDLVLPKRSIVVRCPQSFSSRKDRLEFGAMLAHEMAHVAGADEHDARLAESRYLRRNGLAGPTPVQIFDTIASYPYSFSDIQRSFEKVFHPSWGSWFRALAATIYAKWKMYSARRNGIDLYDFAEDYRTSAAGARAKRARDPTDGPPTEPQLSP